MKRSVLSLHTAIILVLVLSGSALMAHGQAAPAGEAGEQPVYTAEFRVEGMTCGLCVTAINKALDGVDGVRAREVDVEAGRVVVTANKNVEVDTLEAAIGSTGYKAELIEVR